MLIVKRRKLTSTACTQAEEYSSYSSEKQEEKDEHG